MCKFLHTYHRDRNWRLYLVQVHAPRLFLPKFLLSLDKPGPNQGYQREILRKTPENNDKTWIKLSEAILGILGDCWEKFICSSLPARLIKEFPASKVHLQPATWLTGKFPSRTYVQTLLASLGVVIGQNSPVQLGWGERRERFLTNST